MAPLTCRSITASATSPGENYKCTIKARCYDEFNPFLPRIVSSTITVPFVALGDVHNCEGRLQRGPCDDDPIDTARASALDANAHEDRRMTHTLHFRVFLSRRLRIPVSVDYATSDGTARAGLDYRTTSGTLTFAAGETAMTISVPVLELQPVTRAMRVMTLTLSNPHPWRRVRLHDATATVLIVNTDPMPRAWIGAVRAHGGGAGAGRGGRPGWRAEPAPGAEARLGRAADRLWARAFAMPGFARALPAVWRGRSVRSWAADERAGPAAGHVLRADRGNAGRQRPLNLGPGAR